jgi:UDP-galactopyranose mutase
MQEIETDLARAAFAAKVVFMTIDSNRPLPRPALRAVARDANAPTPSTRNPAPACDWLVVGAGFAGSTLAERIASVRNERVWVIDRRPHIAGNAYDEHDAAGVLIHRYGPHIFHTNSQAIFDHLSQFTRWRPYEHRVLAHVDGMLLPVPINLDTINRLYGLDLDPAALAAWFEQRAEPRATIANSEDVVVSKVGRELYEKFFRGYTRKQWGLDPSQLDKAVTSRVPVRTNRDDRYFTDTHQQMPAEGYTAMFQRMLDHPNIELTLGADHRDLPRASRPLRTIFTGPVDEFFDHRFGALPYRCLRFEHRTLDCEQHQPVAVVNYPQTEDYTRITEYKHLTGQRHAKTSITREYPCDDGDPYYPVPRDENQALYERYRALADATPNVWFVGRLATYRYYNMDQVVGQALATFKRIQETVPLSRERAGQRASVAAS